jgi:hypothetical protein
MTKEEVKRGRGRPRKVANADAIAKMKIEAMLAEDEMRARLYAKPKNPDCEVATKGYVKCIARKTTKHAHAQTCRSTFTLLSVLFLTCSWVVCAFIIHDSTIAWISGVGALMMVAVALDHDADYAGKTETSDIDGNPITPHGYPEYLQKYTPPTCEKKKECDD